jgi:hypothetical protein
VEDSAGDLSITTTWKQSRSLAAKTGREMKPYFLTKSKKTDTHPNISESDMHSLSRKKPASKDKHTEPEVRGMETAEEQWHGCDQCCLRCMSDDFSWNSRFPGGTGVSYVLF